MEPLDAIEYASTACHICPNRVWEIGSRFDDWETQLPRLLLQYGEYIGGAIDAQDHMACTVEFCERSALNFTNVVQRHEPLYCMEPCYRLQGLFDERLLVKELSFVERRPTAWALDGLSIVSPSQPFMAISHVWSDGTGTGGWPAGEVNACLFRYFEQIARSFQCEGIWWDAVCLPSSKDARSAAVNNMDINYQYATVTLVHDCFLRRLPWMDDPDAACFALIMSPWFSRGWTALELARSPSVKIVFADDTIVDLDADILDVVGDDNPAASSIRALRNPIEQLDDLLDVLGSRHTSWTRDMAIIAGLLTGISNASGAQRAIYQAILLKIGQLSHGHLFHKHATMSGSFSWCPTSLFQLPRARGDACSMLRVTDQGELRGSWKAVHLDAIPIETYVWGLSHPLVERAMQSALADKRMCVLLAEPTAESVGRGILVKLWKHREDGSNLKCQYLGSLFFHPGIALEHALLTDLLIGDVEGWQQLDNDEDAWDMLWQLGTVDNPSPANSQGDTPSRLPSTPTSNPAETYLTEPTPSTATGPGTVVSIRLARPTPEQIGSLPDGRLDPMSVARNRILEVKNAKGKLSSKDRYSRTLLHWAAGVGDMQTFQLVLHAFRTEGASLAEMDLFGRNCLHVAIQRSQRGVVRVLLNLKLHLDMIRAQDMWGQTALHLAVARNDPMAIEWLVEELDSATLRIEDSLGSTALALAARCLFDGPIMTMLQKYVADGSIYARDRAGKTVLHHAARNDNLQAVEFLLSLWPEEHIMAKSHAGETALHVAARSGSLRVVKALMARWPREHVADLSGSGENALHLAAGEKSCMTIEFLADCWPREYITARTSGGLTALDVALLQINTQAIMVLLDRWSQELLTAASEVSDQDSLLFRAASQHPSMFNLFVERWPEGCRTLDRDTCRSAFYLVSRITEPGSVEALETLMGWMPSVEDIVAPSDTGHTALHLAIADEKALQLLLNRWPEKLLTSTMEGWGETALHLAAAEGYAGSVRVLLERWPPKYLTAKTSAGETALHLAVTSGNPEAVGVLLDYWPPKLVAAKTASGRTVFELAALRKSVAVLKLLDDRVPGKRRSLFFSGTRQLLGVDAEEATMQRILRERLPQADQDTVAWFAAVPLHDAAARGRTEDVQVLMERLSPEFVIATTHAGETALHLAAQGGHTQTVEALCRRWPREHMASTLGAGLTALHIAVTSDNLEMAAVLLAHCPQLASARADDGKTALHMAASRGNLAMLQLLIPRLSAEDLHAVDMRRESALDLAVESGVEACVQLLLQKLFSGPGAIPAAGGRWPFVGAIAAAVRSGNEAMVRMLIGHHPPEQFQSLRDEMQVLAEDKSSLPVGAVRGKIEALLRLL